MVATGCGGPLGGGVRWVRTGSESRRPPDRNAGEPALGWLPPDPDGGGAMENRSKVRRPSSLSEPLPPPSIAGNEVKDRPLQPGAVDPAGKGLDLVGAGAGGRGRPPGERARLRNFGDWSAADEREADEWITSRPGLSVGAYRRADSDADSGARLVAFGPFPVGLRFWRPRFGK